MFKLKTAPALEPVTSTEAKLHLKVDDTTDDNLITALISAAREACENYTGRAFINQTWEGVFDTFPGIENNDLFFTLRPALLSSIISIIYKDTDGNLQTLATTVYEADTYTVPGRACLKYGQSWPASQDIQNAVTVTFVAGYGAAASNVPGPIKQAMLMLIGHLYEHRESVSVGVSVTEMPQGVQFLLDPYRIIEC